MNYRVLLGDDSVSQLYGGVEALPTTFLIDRDGKIASVHVGLAGKDEYLNEIETYTLVKKDSAYELIQVNTSRDRKEYEYKELKEKYARAGLSPFWLGLAELSY